MPVSVERSMRPVSLMRKWGCDAGAAMSAPMAWKASSPWVLSWADGTTAGADGAGLAAFAASMVLRRSVCSGCTCASPAAGVALRATSPSVVRVDVPAVVAGLGGTSIGSGALACSGSGMGLEVCGCGARFGCRAALELARCLRLGVDAGGWGADSGDSEMDGGGRGALAVCVLGVLVRVAW